MEGNLTATIHHAPGDEADCAKLIAALETRVGRIVFNGYPTGVEVCQAMVHGGPYPSTSDGRSTSVGGRAIDRFVRAVCYQDAPAAILPKNCATAIRRESRVWSMASCSRGPRRLKLLLRSERHLRADV